MGFGNFSLDNLDLEFNSGSNVTYAKVGEYTTQLTNFAISEKVNRSGGHTFIATFTVVKPEANAGEIITKRYNYEHEVGGEIFTQDMFRFEAAKLIKTELPLKKYVLSHDFEGFVDALLEAKLNKKFTIKTTLKLQKGSDIYTETYINGIASPEFEPKGPDADSMQKAFEQVKKEEKETSSSTTNSENKTETFDKVGDEDFDALFE